MAPKKKTVPICAPIPIGDCEVTVESSSFTYESRSNSLQITVSRKANINITVKGGSDGCLEVNDDMGLLNLQGKGKEQRDTPSRDEHLFVLIDPKNAESHSKALLQEVINLYMKELPDMNFAANTRKESMFLERCISNGKLPAYCRKYRTLVLQSKPLGGIEEILAAISFQIVPVDTQYAEIPLAAVSAIHQHKGIGRLLYTELRKRLQSVGVRTIYCWGDAESKGFWVKQGFESIAVVGTKGRARRLPIKSNIQRVLCFPGGSTLMVSHLIESISADPLQSTKSSSPQLKGHDGFKQAGDSRIQVLTTEVENSSHEKSAAAVLLCEEDLDNTMNGTGCFETSTGNKKRVWESSLSSLKSKKVKGTHSTNSQMYSADASLTLGSNERNCCFRACSIGVSNDNFLLPDVHLSNDREKKFGKCSEIDVVSEAPQFRVILMNIADDIKRGHLTKVIEELGGTVVSDGALSTHVITGKARRTLNFCTALSSGAWIVSPVWLKESARAGRFVDELPYILVDEDYVSKYRSNLKAAVLRAKAQTHALLQGYYICIATHVQPPAKTLASIVVSAGGQTIQALDEVKDPSKAIFIACEEDMEEALVAVKKGVWTFGSEWFMSCIMRQELDLDAPQFAESL